MDRQAERARRPRRGHSLSSAAIAGNGSNDRLPDPQIERTGSPRQLSAWA